MTKEVPLSLQVFHSRNEYEAQRLNRTEQIRLRDLHDVLKREEKLYVKDQALFKQKFNSHYKRRQSEPVLNRMKTSSSISGSTATSSLRIGIRPASVSSRSSIFSAPGKLQTIRANSVDSSLTSRMCSSLGEISTMTRFQRIKRKFSIVSFTENGLLTKRGSKMSENIDKAREILFKRGNNNFEFPNIKERNCSEKLSSDSSINDKKECGINIPDKERIIQQDVNDDENRQTAEDDRLSQFSNLKDDDKHIGAGSVEPEPFNNSSTRRQKVFSLGSIVEEIPNSDSTDKQEQIVYTSEATDLSSHKIPSQNFKKRVTIRSDIDKSDAQYESHQTLGNEDNNDFSNKDFTEWKSILSRSMKKVDPLQQKINVFLSDQNDFNRIFPKRSDGKLVTCALQKELAAIGKDKKAQELKERKNKNKIVLEVLDTLGIEDENILCMYKD